MDLHSFRERLRKLDDTTLRKFVRAAQFFASTQIQGNKDQQIT